jgi:lipoprotein signal peptidase
VRSAALVFSATAVLLGSVDLAHKASVDAAHLHSRSPVYVVVVLGLAAAWAVTILATQSLSLALGGGVLAGGALGNLASLALWPGVPNPIELEPIALNLADLFVLGGFLLTSAAALLFAARNRERLYEPVGLRSRRAR